MANTLTEVIPQLLAQGLLALRENAVMPRLVNRAYETMAGPEGSTIDVPIPSAVTVNTVVPGNTSQAVSDVAPTSVSIPLDQWKEAAFTLSDKEQLEVMRGTLPMQASEAIKGLANDIDGYILGLCNKFYGYYQEDGSIGTAVGTPFEDGSLDPTNTRAASQIRRLLNEQLSPMDPRYVVINPEVEASAMNLRAFQDASFGVGADVILEGNLNRRLGFTWIMDQNVTSHTQGDWPDIYNVNNTSGYAVGTKTMAIDGGTTSTSALNVGDVFKIGSNAQTYVVTTAVSGASGNLSFEPGLQTAAVDDDALTGALSHGINPAFHRDAIAFATRPLLRSTVNPEGMRTAVDPISGIALRLEVVREHKQDRFSWDVLYGGEVIRREFGVRLASGV